MSLENKLLDALAHNSLHIDGEINWNSRDFQRFRVKNHWRRGKPLFVCVHGDSVSFGDWRDPSTWKTVWERSWSELNEQEKQERERGQARLKHEKELMRNHAIWRAKLMLSYEHRYGFPVCHDAAHSHPYVKLKRIIPYYAKQIRSYLIIPITDANRNLQSLQYIKAGGFKQFKKHATPKGGMLYLCEKIEPDDIIYVCEGYATGCSIREATISPVVVSFGASNIVEVAVALRIRYPLNQMMICADNDAWNATNTGMIYATKAAHATGSQIIWPDFGEFDTPDRPTDFNDLFCLGGIEAVERQLKL